MTAAERQRLFLCGLAAYHQRQLQQADLYFSRVVDDGSTEPRHLSYCGLLMATVKGKVREGLELCEEALDRAFYDPEMYVNLARLHLQTGWKSRAVKILRAGLQTHPNDVRLLTEIQRVSPRRMPPIPLLDRRHALNRYLGLLRTKLLQSLGRMSATL